MLSQTKIMLLAGVAAVSAVIPVSQAAVYTCNIGGTIVYTSRMGANCRNAQLPTLGSYTSSRSVYAEQARRSDPEPERTAKRTKAAAPKAAPTPVQLAAPKIPGNSGRRSILEQELANERQALAKTQSELAAARTAKNGSIDQQRINNLQASVTDRQLNIQALQRELSRM